MTISAKQDRSQTELSSAKRFHLIRNVTIIGIIVNTVLGFTKLIAGIVGNSQALIADGAHSFSDLATDALVFIGAKHGSREADDKHPYGHGRIETVFTIIVGSILAIVAFGIVYDAIQRLFDPSVLLHPDKNVLYVATFSILANEFLYYYTKSTANKINSTLLMANAWHHRSDSVSSLVVVCGVTGTLIGFPYLDAVAAVLVALMISKMGIELIWNGFQELVDTSLDDNEITLIQDSINSVNGVRAIHMLRTRRMSNHALIDVHLIVDPKISVSEGHQIAEIAQHRLKKNLTNISDVTIHIDPEDDEVQAPNRGLPNREETFAMLQKTCASIKEFQFINNIVLHYLNGKLDVELEIPLQNIQDLAHAKRIASEFETHARQLPMLGKIKVVFS